jgi:hypothetical protein
MNKYIIKETKVFSGNPVDLATLALDIIAYTDARDGEVEMEWIRLLIILFVIMICKLL